MVIVVVAIVMVMAVAVATVMVVDMWPPLKAGAMAWRRGT